MWDVRSMAKKIRGDIAISPLIFKGYSWKSLATPDVVGTPSPKDLVSAALFFLTRSM
jgi:hypothetical protein